MLKGNNKKNMTLIGEHSAVLVMLFEFVMFGDQLMLNIFNQKTQFIKNTVWFKKLIFF